MSVWELLLLVAPALYAGQMLRFRQAWLRQAAPRLAPAEASHPAELGPKDSPPAKPTPPHISVLIAARNEAAHLPTLLADLQRQSLPASGFEVIIVDDHSEDATAEIIHLAAAESSFALRLIQLGKVPGPALRGKKAALQVAISQARGEWMVCTDADCRLPQAWLRSHCQAHRPGVHFVSGPVLLTGRGALAALQGLELAGLVGVGAACIALGQPTMCNGANLSYRRASFAAVGGFAGHQHVASGDDEFLLHQLHAAYPAGIEFIQTPEALVRTAAQPTLPQLLRQRVRWASKWAHYRTAAPRRLAVLVLLANVAVAVGLLVSLWQSAYWPWALGAALLKMGADVLFLFPVLSFFKRRQWLWWVPVLQLLYAPYGVAVGLAGLRGGYEWKGRSIITPRK